MSQKKTKNAYTLSKNKQTVQKQKYPKHEIRKMMMFRLHL